MKNRAIFTISICFAAALSLLVSGGSAAPESYFPYVGEKGSIMLPSGYRANWVHMGSWAVAEKEAPGYGFHDVYAQQSTVEGYRKTGQFPDGAVLVKEIRKVRTEEMTTGKTSYADEITTWFVMIKDRQGRYKDNPNWGNGWGWGLFEPDDTGKNLSTDHAKDCIGCHIPAKSTDWVYVRGYPTLK